MQQLSDYPNFFCVDHPLIKHKLTQMRDRECQSYGFRSLLHEISQLIAFEIFRDLPLTTRRIKTPVCEMQAPTLADPTLCIVPVLRAGLAMADGLLRLMPTAQVGHIGVYRDHETKQAVEYLVRLPKNTGQTYFVVDPMLATGNSLVHACEVLVKHGVSTSHIRAMALVAAPEGVKHFSSKYPDVPVYCAALDEKLNEHAYIIPGLGDAGDRMYQTE